MAYKSENEQQPLQLLPLEEQYLQSHQEIKQRRLRAITLQGALKKILIFQLKYWNIQQE